MISNSQAELQDERFPNVPIPAKISREYNIGFYDLSSIFPRIEFKTYFLPRDAVHYSKQGHNLVTNYLHHE